MAISSHPSFQISSLIEKMNSADKDFRYMATNDLMLELQKDAVKLDDNSEKKVVTILLRLLEDKNIEVENLAVKCLGPLVNKVKVENVNEVVDVLCLYLMSDKEQLRDIAVIGLKTVIVNLPVHDPTLTQTVVKRITCKLIHSLTKGEIVVQLEALEMLVDVLERFGNSLVSFHDSIQRTLLPMLVSTRHAVRKRTILALGCLVVHSSPVLFAELLNVLLVEIQKNQSSFDMRSYVQCIVAIGKSAGPRLGEHLGHIIQVVVRQCETEDDELREYCLQVLEVVARKCPKEVGNYIETMVEISMRFLSYDPNYNYGEDEDMEECEEEDSSDGYSDDDDFSWKVRRAAAKCLEGCILSRRDKLDYFMKSVPVGIIHRFKEREESVKVDIFNTFIALVRQVKSVKSMSVNSENGEMMDLTETPVAQLLEVVPLVIRSCERMLRNRRMRIRQGVLTLFNEIASACPNCFSNHLSSILPGLQFSLSDENGSKNAKIDVLVFLNTLLSTHPPHIFQPYLPELIPHITQCVMDSFYKITSEALQVAKTLISVIRPLEEGELQPTTQQQLMSVMPVYNCIYFRLKATDIDQEVKERALAAIGEVFFHLGDVMSVQFNECVTILLDRLQNEITRLAAVKTCASLSCTPLPINLTPLISGSLPTLATFLRKNMRVLKLATLQCLSNFCARLGPDISLSFFIPALREIPPLISEVDIHVSHLSLGVVVSVLRGCGSPAVEPLLRHGVLEAVRELLCSPLLQGGIIEVIMELFELLASSGVEEVSYDRLLDALTVSVRQGKTSLHRHALSSLARCLAVLAKSHPVQGRRTVASLLSDLSESVSGSTDQVLFSLHSLGEVGALMDLSEFDNLRAVIMNKFASSHEEIRQTAASVLGKVAVGNLSIYLPLILSDISSHPKRQYLLLTALREVISHESVSHTSVDHLKPHLDNIWSLLMSECECGEEGTRNVVSECVGKLCLIEPEVLITKVTDDLNPSFNSARKRAVLITAIKYYITDKPQSTDRLLKSNLEKVVSSLNDEDLTVRQVTLVTLNSLIHNKPWLVRDILPSFLPLLYRESLVRKELIREVEMGPFKHNVDDGLELRKAAFECIHTLVGSCFDRIDLFELLTHVELGLKDVYDIRILTDITLIRLAALAPAAVLLQWMDRLVEPLKVTCKVKVKADSVKQEFEKLEESKRSALRALMALLRAVPGAEKCHQVVDIMGIIRNSAELKILFESIEREMALHSGGADGGLNYRSVMLVS